VNRLISWFLLVIAVLCMPLSCVTGLMLFNFANPMARAFLTDFTVRNSSGEIVHITPIGTVGEEGHRRQLPLSLSSEISIPASTASDFRLAPNEERRFTYDWDDINFSEVAVRDERGKWRELVVDPQPTERQYRPPAEDSFVIPPFSELPEATEPVRAAAVRPSSRVSIVWVLSLLGVFPPVLLVYCLRRLRSPRPNAIPRTAMAP
jgi:hypothetical protein